MILTVDIGNTNTTLGIFDEGKLIATWNMASDIKRSDDEYGITLYNLISHIQNSSSPMHTNAFALPNTKTTLQTPKKPIKITGAIIASVVLALTPKYSDAIKKYLNIEPLILTHKLKTGMKIAIDKPSELGADRIANGAAAISFYRAPAIVVDFGTATTFDIVDAQKEFVGGIIAPGLKIQAKSLNEFTSKLPNLKIEAAKSPIGTNTIDAMLSGIVRGHACMIDGMIELCEKQLGGCATIIATGGCTPIIQNCLKRPFDIIDKNLTLKGLMFLYDLNRQNI